MTEPSDYQRPASWPTLEDPDEGGPDQPGLADAPPADWPQDRAASPEPGTWPETQADYPPQYATQPPPSPLDAAAPAATPPVAPAQFPGYPRATEGVGWPSISQPRGWRVARQAVRPRRSRVGLAFGLLAGFIALIVLVPIMQGGTSRPRPSATYTPTPPPPDLGTVWVTKPGQVRTDLSGAEFVDGVDGSMDGGYLADLQTSWIALTGTPDDKQIVLHALNPKDGTQLWSRPLAQGLCATERVTAGLVCAEAIASDPVTGLGTRWRLLVLNDQTGTVLRSTELDGWFTLLHVHDNRIMLVEQRQPAPDARIRLLNEKLGNSRELDLSTSPQHAGLFSDNRIVYRHFPIPKGPALDRPRIRHVADGLIALWSGASTAFIDPARGRLVGLLHCSRLVDDGQRLWCNDGEQAVAYDYRLKRLAETPIGLRLAFPVRDPQEGDVTDPVFIDMQGITRRVDPATGKALGVLVPTTNASVWGMTLEPQVAFTKGRTLISDKGRTFAVDARGGQVLWRSDEFEVGGPVTSRGADLLVLESTIRRIDAATGRVLSSYAQRVGLYTAFRGDTLVGYGPDEIGRLVDP